MAHIFGAMSVIWQLKMLMMSIYERYVEQIWIDLTCLLWLGGHFWWMDGELHDYKYPNDKPQYDAHTKNTIYIFIIASSIVTFYYIIIKPMQIILSRQKNDNENNLNWKKVEESKSESFVSMFFYSPPPPEAKLENNEGLTLLAGRFPGFFRNWGEYENIHVLFWLLKDTGWALWIPSMVVVFFVPTFLLAIDFVWLTMHVKHGIVDHVHYVSLFV
jgi:hypothetical protein